jgi:hypothetical protein
MNYIIIIEIENLGFVFKSKLSQDEIMTYINEIFFQYQNYEVEKIHTIKNLILIDHYTINGNQLYIRKCEKGITNGFISASLILLTPNFCLKSLIKERENYSIPFDIEDDATADKIEKLIELFPKQVLSAN